MLVDTSDERLLNLYYIHWLEYSKGAEYLNHLYKWVLCIVSDIFAVNYFSSVRHSFVPENQFGFGISSVQTQPNPTSDLVLAMQILTKKLAQVEKIIIISNQRGLSSLIDHLTKHEKNQKKTYLHHNFVLKLSQHTIRQKKVQRSRFPIQSNKWHKWTFIGHRRGECACRLQREKIMNKNNYQSASVHLTDGTWMLA